MQTVRISISNTSGLIDRNRPDAVSPHMGDNEWTNFCNDLDADLLQMKNRDMDGFFCLVLLILIFTGTILLGLILWCVFGEDVMRAYNAWRVYRKIDKVCLRASAKYPGKLSFQQKKPSVWKKRTEQTQHYIEVSASYGGDIENAPPAYVGYETMAPTAPTAFHLSAIEAEQTIPYNPHADAMAPTAPHLSAIEAEPTIPYNPHADAIPSTAAADLVGEITKLAALRDQGVLSEEEFSDAKKKLLGN
mmetsp:Transcript_19962/g.30750  ORF Transcript_19962/g.30750 Transcript_19962/m.30750 type:complete len:247 (-) Transcript_19962:60-800(-)